MCGYTSSIVCKIYFDIICLALTLNASIKKTSTRFINKKLGGNQKLLFSRHQKNAWYSTYEMISYPFRCVLIILMIIRMGNKWRKYLHVNSKTRVHRERG